jgi:oligopeptide/dipeptide ABC transporter ATP-binding protein
MDDTPMTDTLPDRTESSDSPTDPSGEFRSRPLAELRGVRKLFPITQGILRRTIGHVRAVDGVDLVVSAGRTVGLVGESGSGKSTLGRVVLRLIEATDGQVLFDGRDLSTLTRREVRSVRKHMQMVFQDPYASLDPMSSVGNSVAEPLRTHDNMSSSQRRDRVAQLLELVNLNPSMAARYPREFSGGQLQRIAIARALALQPRLLVLDEPVSSLDVSTQADVINLLHDLQNQLGVAYLFIAHDLAVVRHVSHTIAVMYLGRIVEQGPTEEVYSRPKHPYTQSLLSAIPVANPDIQRDRHRIVLTGDIPSPISPPTGCRFHTRCPHVMDICKIADPDVFVTPDGTHVACHLHTVGPTLCGDTVLGLPLPTMADV